jgi:hypothetical protein
VATRRGDVTRYTDIERAAAAQGWTVQRTQMDTAGSSHLTRMGPRVEVERRAASGARQRSLRSRGRSDGLISSLFSWSVGTSIRGIEPSLGGTWRG